MNYLDEIEGAKKAYELRVTAIKEKWVNSPNVWLSVREYDEELQVATTEYDTKLRAIRSKY